VSFRYRNDRKTWLVDTVWPDKIRTRVSAPDKASAMKLDMKIRAAMIDERRVWKKLRSELGLDGERLQGFSELADKYISDYCMNNNRNPRQKQNRLNAMKRYFSTLPIDSLAVNHVDGYISARKKQGITNGSINYDITILKHLCSWAKSRGYIETDPLVSVSLLKQIERVGERPDESLIDTIFSNMAPMHIPLFRFIRETGCRQGEAISLTWDKIDYTKAIVTFHTTTKNGKARQVPLTASALSALSSMPRHGKTVFYRLNAGSVQKWRYSSIDRVWRKATEKVTVGTVVDAHSSKLRIHDLRHAYAIRLAESGCPMHFISKVLGHSNTEFTRKKYT
jgi:integrase